jgi:Tol biopolymer transport system component
MRALLLFLFVAVLLAACTGEISCSDPGRDIIPSDPEVADAQAAWSPDGKTIAVAWAGKPSFRRQGLFLIDTSDWTVDTLLIADEYSTPSFSSPSWSATGEWLVFAASAQIHKIKANSDSLTQLTFTSRQWHCDWANSDTLIAYKITIGDSAGLWLMDTEGEGKRVLVRYGGDIDFTIGDSILFVEYVPSDHKFAHIILINPVDSSTREVYRWEQGKPYHFYSDPKASPNGKIIVLSIEGNIWTMTVEGKNLKQLTSDGGGYPNWSPDGSKIVYCKPSLEGGTLWIMNSDGSEKAQVPGW